jgi:hypothetical protein
MSTGKPFPIFAETLDADEPIGKTYTWKIEVVAGDSVTAAVVQEVDSNSAGAPTLSLVTLSEQSLGMISTLLYGATVRVQGKSLAGTAYLRCRYATALGNGDDATWVLPITQR